MRTAPRVELSVEDRAWLEKVSRSRVETVRLSERALIVLMAADGKTNREIGMSLGITEEKAARWRGRFNDQGRTGIEQDAQAGGASRPTRRRSWRWWCAGRLARSPRRPRTGVAG